MLSRLFLNFGDTKTVMGHSWPTVYFVHFDETRIKMRTGFELQTSETKMSRSSPNAIHFKFSQH